jgi:hypothetical protein
MSRAAVFLNIEKAFDKSWYLGLLYKLSESKFTTSLIKLNNYFLFHSKFRVPVEGEMSTPKDIQAGEPQGSVLPHTLYSLYINDTTQTSGVYLDGFADDTCIYATDRKEGYVFRNLQRCLGVTETWCFALEHKWQLR